MLIVESNVVIFTARLVCELKNISDVGFEQSTLVAQGERGQFLDSLHNVSEWNTENALRAPARFGGDVCPKVRRSQFTFAVTR